MRKGHGHDLCAPCDRRLGILCVSRFPRQRYVSIFFPEENSNTEGEGASPSLSTDNQIPLDQNYQNWGLSAFILVILRLLLVRDHSHGLKCSYSLSWLANSSFLNVLWGVREFLSLKNPSGPNFLWELSISFCSSIYMESRFQHFV